MNGSGDAAEQIVRMTLNGAEVAIKLVGAGAKNIAAFLFAALSSNNKQPQTKLKGKERLKKMLKSGEALESVCIKKRDMQRFSEEAKRYGFVYSVGWNKKGGAESPCVITVKKKDASRVNNILSMLGFADVDRATIRSELIRTKNGKRQPIDKGVREKSEREKLLDDLFSKPNEKEKTEIKNLQTAKTEKSRPSEPLFKPREKSENTSKQRPSVERELNDIKSELKRKADKLREDNRTKKQHKQRGTRHTQPQRKRKSKSKAR